jgi:hypothetical protein
LNAAEEIERSLNLPDDFIKQMFDHKSRIDKDNILDFLDHDYAEKLINGKKIGMVQLEITNLEKVIGNFRKEISDYLSEVKKSVDYLLFMGIDIYEGFNILITADEKSDKFFSNVLGIDRIGGYYKTQDIIMRKEIWPKIKL